ncbi:hypothetical protein ABPG72_001522 [Tetrahymena utriculariae]
MNELDNQINIINDLSYVRNIYEYDSDSGFQKSRMKKKTLMDSIQNRFYHNIQKIRLSVDEINNQRMLMQNKDQTPILTPIFQSVQTLIGKQRVKEAKMYTGKETVPFDSQLFEIPLMNEEVKQYQKVVNMKKSNNDLLKFNKIETQIKVLNEKLKDREKPVSIKLNESSEDQPEIFKQKNVSHKKKQSKQESIQNRISYQQKQLTSELQKKQFFQQIIKLQNKKKLHFIECDQSIKALYFQRLDKGDEEGETTEYNSPMLQNSKSLTKSIFLKNNQSSKILGIDTSQNRRSIDQSEGLNPSYVGCPSPIKKKLSSIYFPNESISKNSMDKSQNNNNSQNLLSPLKLKSHTQSNQNSIQSSNLKIEQISRAQSFIYPYKLQDIKEKVQRTEKMNPKDEKQMISESLQVMLDSIMEEKQKKKLRQGTIFQNKLQSQNEGQQFLSSSTSNENVYFKENTNHTKTQNLSSENKKFRKSQLSYTSNVFLNKSNAFNGNYEDLDDKLIIKMEKNKIRGERLIQLKKKLGLIDQNTRNNEQIYQIVKEIDNIHKEQEEQNREKIKPQSLQQIQKNKQQKKALLTFTKNENYQLLKSYVKQKRRSFQNQNHSEGRMSLIQNSSLNQRVNKSMLTNDNLSIQDGEQYSVEGTLLSTNRSQYDKIQQQKRQAQNLTRSEQQRKLRNENSLSSSSFPEKSIGFRQSKKSVDDINYDSYKIQYRTFQNQNQRKHQKDQASQMSQNSLTNKISINKFSEQNSLSPTQNRVFNFKINKNQSQMINLCNDESSKDKLSQVHENENSGGLNLFRNLNKVKYKKLSEKTLSSVSLKTLEGISQSDNFGILKDIQKKQITEQNKNNKQQAQQRNRLQNNSLNKRVDQHQQQEPNPIIVQSFLVNNSNSLLDRSNIQHKLYQPNNLMKYFFRQKVNLKKEFGERVTETDRETFACKAKVSNFFDNVLEYQEQSKLNSKNINNQINKCIKTFSSHLIGWKNELQESNQDYNNHMQLNTLKTNKNIAIKTKIDNLQELQEKNLLKF